MNSGLNFWNAGTNLSNNITITAPTGYALSLTSGGTYTNSLTLNETGGTVSTTTIYVKFSPTSIQSYSGNIANVSTGATTVNVAVSGNGSVGISENTSNILNINVLPNPFNDKTTLEYSIAEIEKNELTIFDITGKELKNIVFENQNIGKQSLELDLSDYESGIYIYSLKINNNEQKGKLIKY